MIDILFVEVTVPAWWLFASSVVSSLLTGSPILYVCWKCYVVIGKLQNKIKELEKLKRDHEFIIELWQRKQEREFELEIKEKEATCLLY